MFYIIYMYDSNEHDEYHQIIGPIPEGQDPLYGYGNWNLYTPQPFETWEAADKWWAENI